MLYLPPTITDQRIENCCLAAVQPSGAFNFINSNIVKCLIRMSNVQVNIKKTCKHDMTRRMNTGSYQNKDWIITKKCQLDSLEATCYAFPLGDIMHAIHI